MAAPQAEIKLFGKWPFDDVEVRRRRQYARRGVGNTPLSGVEAYSCKHCWPGDRYLPGGLHRSQAQVRCVRATHRWPLPEEAVPEGAMPHRRAVRTLKELNAAVAAQFSSTPAPTQQQRPA